jgi:hypothetical protein
VAREAAAAQALVHRANNVRLLGVKQPRHELVDCSLVRFQIGPLTRSLERIAVTGWAVSRVAVHVQDIRPAVEDIAHEAAGATRERLDGIEQRRRQ